MKLKNLAKKGGVADIVTLMIIVGLVIALIIAVVLPMVNQASNTGANTSSDMTAVQGATDGLKARGDSALTALTGAAPAPEST